MILITFNIHMTEDPTQEQIDEWVGSQTLLDIESAEIKGGVMMIIPTFVDPMTDSVDDELSNDFHEHFGCEEEMA